MKNKLSGYGDVIIFGFICLVAALVIFAEIYNFNALIKNIKLNFLINGPISGFMVCFGCILPYIIIFTSFKYGVLDTLKNIKKADNG